MDEKTITLRKPIVLGGVTVAELNLREPVALELSRATEFGKGNGVAFQISLIHQVAEVPMAVVNQLCQRDLLEAGDFLNSFGGTGLATGEMSSQS